MRLLLLLCLSAAAFAVDLKPNEDLPYVRLTIIQGAGEPNVMDQGWWDKDLHLLFHEKADAFGCSYPDERIAKMETAAPGAVKRMPDYARRIVAERLAENRKQAAR